MKIEWRREYAMGAGVITAVVSFLAMAMALGWVDLSDSQLASIEAFLKAAVPVLAVIVPLVLNWLVRQRVTPMNDPRTADGRPAVIVSKDLLEENDISF